MFIKVNMDATHGSMNLSWRCCSIRTNLFALLVLFFVVFCPTFTFDFAAFCLLRCKILLQQEKRDESETNWHTDEMQNDHSDRCHLEKNQTCIWFSTLVLTSTHCVKKTRVRLKIQYGLQMGKIIRIGSLLSAVTVCVSVMDLGPF